MFAKAAEPENETAATQLSISGDAAQPQRVQQAITTGEQYIAQLQPLVQDVPWSAPAFVGREVVSDPHLYCMSTENSCRCVTEQNTRVVLRDDVCRDVARNGELYNPFKAPAGQNANPQPYGQGSSGSHRRAAGRSSSVALRWPGLSLGIPQVSVLTFSRPTRPGPSVATRRRQAHFESARVVRQVAPTAFDANQTLSAHAAFAL